ncbi:hypothetical protein RHGRI_037907 [Rhododendron griersonianum]|nr:hypothetical protein RHGRI_037907 [Rhododendron griersonianum]
MSYSSSQIRRQLDRLLLLLIAVYMMNRKRECDADSEEQTARWKALRLEMRAMRKRKRELHMQSFIWDSENFDWENAEAALNHNLHQAEGSPRPFTEWISHLSGKCETHFEPSLGIGILRAHMSVKAFETNKSNADPVRMDRSWISFPARRKPILARAGRTFEKVTELGVSPRA